MKGQKPALRVAWGHLALLLVFCCLIITYLLDARATSLNTNNLLLVQPGSIVALLLATIVLPQCFRRSAPATTNPTPPNRQLQRGALLSTAALGSAFGAFVFSLETVGFDVATFLFTAFGLYVCGERKLWLIGAFSTLFTLLIVYGYKLLVPYPFPLTVL
jgi:hypothetical protein